MLMVLLPCTGFSQFSQISLLLWRREDSNSRDHTKSVLVVMLEVYAL